MFERAIVFIQNRTRTFAAAGALIAALAAAIATFTDVGRHLKPIAPVLYGWLNSNVVKRVALNELCQNEDRQERALRALNNFEAQLKKDNLEAEIRKVYQASADRAKKKMARLERRHKTLQIEIGLDGDEDSNCD
jgi:hypothetical protein